MSEVTWQHRKDFTESHGDSRIEDCWATKIDGKNDGAWAVYLANGKWRLYYWVFREEVWDTLEEAKIVSTALYRMGHFEGWHFNDEEALI